MMLATAVVVELSLGTLVPRRTGTAVEFGFADTDAPREIVDVNLNCVVWLGIADGAALARLDPVDEPALDLVEAVSTEGTLMLGEIVVEEFGFGT